MIRDALAYTFNARTDNPISLRKKLANVEAFSGLDRNGLSYQDTERRLLLYTTSLNERVFIQYPGKESIRQANTKPWDFRPKIEKDGSLAPDLSFADIWDDLVNLHLFDSEAVSVLAAIFFRMAYLIDYEKYTDICSYHDIIASTGNQISSGNVSLTWYRPNFTGEVYDYLNQRIGLIRGFSYEAYLLYNDLLVQNEDCKYYYREMYERGKPWKGTPGRENTMLSHLSCIEYAMGKISFSEIMNRFWRGMGVAPVPKKSIPIVTNGIINT